MNTRRKMRLVIMLFLLAALPLVTAAVAQGQEPGSPNQPEYTCNRYEATTDVIGVNDVLCGEIDNSGNDWDIYRFTMPTSGQVVIWYEGWYGCIDLADAAGRWVARSCYWDSFGPRENMTERRANPFLLVSLASGNYWINVIDEEETRGPYQLGVARPLLLSASAAGFAGGGTVGGIRFDARDILVHARLNTGEDYWQMAFDASQAGITRNVTNIAADTGERLLLTLANNQTLPNVGLVTPWDIFLVDGGANGGSFGPGTSWGPYSMGLQGQSQQLTTAAEKLDAIDGWVNGYNRCYGFPVSTAGVASVTGWLGTMKQDDEDVFCKVYNGAWQPYDWFFDVKGVNNAPATEPLPGRVPGLAAEDVVAMAYDDTRNVMYLTIAGTGTIWGHRVTQKDIFAINYPSYSWGGIVWHGPDHGWNYNIDAIELKGW